MIRLALQIDPKARKLRERHQTEVVEVERQANAQIAKARIKVLDRRVPPDATFTLRLAFGVVRGYTADGKDLPHTTTFGGTIDRAVHRGNQPPFCAAQPLVRRNCQGRSGYTVQFCLDRGRHQRQFRQSCVESCG